MAATAVAVLLTASLLRLRATSRRRRGMRADDGHGDGHDDDDGGSDGGRRGGGSSGGGGGGGSDRTRLLTYNVHSCVGEDGVYDVGRVASVVRSTGAAIVCLQEIECNTGKGGR